MFEPTDALEFAIVFARVAAMFALLPNVAGVFPARMRIGAAAVLTMLVAPLVSTASVDLDSGAAWCELAIEQAFWGAMLGGTMRLWFTSCAVAGAWISQAAGWGAGEATPEGQELPSALSQFHGWLGGIAFLAVDGPNMFVRAILDSFSAVPVSGVAWNGAPLADYVATALRESLWLALRMGSPVLTSIVAASIAIAAIQRAIPNVNLVRFQIAGNWLVLLVALALTIGLNVDHWGQDISGLVRAIPSDWSQFERSDHEFE